MKRAFLKSVFILVSTLISAFSFQTGYSFSQTPSEIIQSEIVEVPGEIYRDILRGQLWSMLPALGQAWLQECVEPEGWDDWLERCGLSTVNKEGLRSSKINKKS